MKRTRQVRACCAAHACLALAARRCTSGGVAVLGIGWGWWDARVCHPPTRPRRPPLPCPIGLTTCRCMEQGIQASAPQPRARSGRLLSTLSATRRSPWPMAQPTCYSLVQQTQPLARLPTASGRAACVTAGWRARLLLLLPHLLLPPRLPRHSPPRHHPPNHPTTPQTIPTATQTLSAATQAALLCWQRGVGPHRGHSPFRPFCDVLPPAYSGSCFRHLRTHRAACCYHRHPCHSHGTGEETCLRCHCQDWLGPAAQAATVIIGASHRAHQAAALSLPSPLQVCAGATLAGGKVAAGAVAAALLTAVKAPNFSLSRLTVLALGVRLNTPAGRIFYSVVSVRGQGSVAVAGWHGRHRMLQRWSPLPAHMFACPPARPPLSVQCTTLWLNPDSFSSHWRREAWAAAS